MEALPSDLPDLAERLRAHRHEPQAVHSTFGPHLPLEAVYLLELVNGPTRYYVGQTRSMWERFLCHAKDKRYSRVWVLSYPGADLTRLLQVESFIADQYPPPLLSKYASGKAPARSTKPRTKSTPYQSARIIRVPVKRELLSDDPLYGMGHDPKVLNTLVGHRVYPGEPAYSHYKIRERLRSTPSLVNTHNTDLSPSGLVVLRGAFTLRYGRNQLRPGCYTGPGCLSCEEHIVRCPKCSNESSSWLECGCVNLEPFRSYEEYRTALQASLPDSVEMVAGFWPRWKDDLSDYR